MQAANHLVVSQRAGRLGRTRARRGFTILELVVAGILLVIVVGTLGLSLNQLGRSRNSVQRRLEAHMRATGALDAIRRDLASVLRTDDLFQTRVLIKDLTKSSRSGSFDRDEILVFSSRLGAVRPNKYQGEGEEYETQFRVTSDDLGAALWQRRDPVPDHTPDGGGVATPLVEGVIAVNFEAYDGKVWYPNWDSDIYGLPWAIRATVTAVGQRNGEDPLGDKRTMVSLRTTIPIDRIVPPKATESAEDKAANAADEAAAAAADAAAAAAGGAGGGGRDGGRGGDNGLGRGGGAAGGAGRNGGGQMGGGGRSGGGQGGRGGNGQMGRGGRGSGSSGRGGGAR